MDLNLVGYAYLECYVNVSLQFRARRGIALRVRGNLHSSVLAPLDRSLHQNSTIRPTNYT